MGPTCKVEDLAYCNNESGRHQAVNVLYTEVPTRNACRVETCGSSPPGFTFKIQGNGSAVNPPYQLTVAEPFPEVVLSCFNSVISVPIPSILAFIPSTLALIPANCTSSAAIRSSSLPCCISTEFIRSSSRSIRLSTASKRLSTSSNRVSTASNRISTASNRISTASNRLSTALNLSPIRSRILDSN